jgi:hypothetical protein
MLAGKTMYAFKIFKILMNKGEIEQELNIPA